MKVYTTFILTSSASITRGVTYAKLTHTVAKGRYVVSEGQRWTLGVVWVFFHETREWPQLSARPGIRKQT